MSGRAAGCRAGRERCQVSLQRQRSGPRNRPAKCAPGGTVWRRRSISLLHVVALAVEARHAVGVQVVGQDACRASLPGCAGGSTSASTCGQELIGAQGVVGIPGNHPGRPAGCRSARRPAAVRPASRHPACRVTCTGRAPWSSGSIPCPCRRSSRAGWRPGCRGGEHSQQKATPVSS